MKPCECSYCSNVRFPFENKHFIFSKNATATFSEHNWYGDRHLEFNKKTKKWRLLK